MENLTDLSVSNEEAVRLIGNLNVRVYALERQLNKALQRIDELTPKSDPRVE